MERSAGWGGHTEVTIWAGIDEAGYGPTLGPLVVGGVAFQMEGPPAEGVLWEVLRDAVSREARTSGGRLVVNDSKRVYSPSLGLRRLEEGVLAFFQVFSGDLPTNAKELMATLLPDGASCEALPPWFSGAPDLALPLDTNASAVKSKAAVLARALQVSGVRIVAAHAAPVFAPEFNRFVDQTGNKSFLLFQKCGLLIEHLWRSAHDDEAHVTVDKHGGRMRYRRLVRDVFPHCGCDVLREEAELSCYRVADGSRELVLSFRQEADQAALPSALASMVAKYVREVHMCAFNTYWCEHVDGLQPTAGYSRDARRFLHDIEAVLAAEKVDLSALVRCC